MSIKPIVLERCLHRTCPMKPVVLRFNDVLKLIEFINVIGKYDVDTDIDSCSIIGKLSDADIELAVRGYEAHVINGA